MKEEYFCISLISAGKLFHSLLPLRFTLRDLLSALEIF